MVLWAGSEAKDLGLEFRAQGFARAARDADAPQITVLELAVEADVQVHMGEFVTEGYCVDVPLPDGAIEHTYDAIRGTATLTVTPTEDVAGGGLFPAAAEVILENVVFELRGGDATQTVEMRTLTLAASVGWFPG